MQTQLSFDDFKLKRRQEILNSLLEGSLIDEGLDLLLVDLFIRLGSNLFVDVGVNKGTYTKIFKENYKDINYLGFEPDERTYNECLKEYENEEKIKIFNRAILNKNGKEKFYFSNDSTQTSSKYYTNRNHMIIKSEKLDNWFDYIKNFKLPFIKIDTEGAEPEVIYSSKKILKNMSYCVLYFEYSYKWLYNEKEVYKLFQFLVQNGFNLFRLNAFGFESIPLMFYDYLKDYHFSNILAVKNIIFNDMIKIDSRFGKLSYYPLVERREIII
jgi:FkbM family methyltransferase